MAMSAILLGEFDQEFGNTRRVLERIPEGKFDWKPHERSMNLGRLATHLTELALWCSHTFERTELDLAPPGAPPYQPVTLSTRAAILAALDENVRRARALLAAATDADFMVPWSLKRGGATIFTLPRIAVYRSFVMNHMIHHRAQLGVYLRLNDVPVPALYGPTADERPM
ncbi:MAG TPA: DinB family protein [Gemmatimonadales bacterium]|jgi:uncharacterized damage-inducible protein DinB|nr:DinB family protein [Gemmatimonadales bacterium]